MAILKKLANAFKHQSQNDKVLKAVNNITKSFSVLTVRGEVVNVFYKGMSITRDDRILFELACSEDVSLASRITFLLRGVYIYDGYATVRTLNHGEQRITDSEYRLISDLADVAYLYIQQAA